MNQLNSKNALDSGRACLVLFSKATSRIELTIRNLYDGLPVRRVAPCDGLEVRRTGKFISAGRLSSGSPTHFRSTWGVVQLRGWLMRF